MLVSLHPQAKALIFDLDGTLADTMPNHYRSWCMLAEKEGFHFPENLFYEWAGVRSIRIAEMLNERFGFNLDPAATEIKKDEMYLALAPTVKVIEPVAHLLRTYAGKMPVSIGTGNVREITELTLEATGLRKYVDIIVTAEDVQNFKPAPDTFLRCAELMGVEPSVCQVFEDGDPGLQAARTANMFPTDIRPAYKIWAESLKAI